MLKKLSDSVGNQITLKKTIWDQKVLEKKTCELSLICKSDDVKAICDLLDEAEKYLKSECFEYVQIRCDSNSRLIKSVLHSRNYYVGEMSLSMSFSNPQRFCLDSINRMKVDLEKIDVSDFDSISFIKSVAYSDFHHGRLLEDVFIKESQGRARTANWIDDLLKSPFDLYKATFRGKIIGFHAEKVNHSDKSVGWILTGVASQYSVYAMPLWCAAFELAKKHEVEKITTMISASNTKVLNLYNRFPFRIDGSWFGFHKNL